MTMSPQITVVGNLVEDPELRFISSGKAVCTLRLAATPSRKDKQTNEWVDGTTMWLRVTAWGQLGENVVESLTKGMKVVVVGRLECREWEDREGGKRTSWEIQADEVSPSLRSATATVRKGQRGGGQGAAAQHADDPWATGQTGTPATLGGGYNRDEPPF